MKRFFLLYLLICFKAFTCQPIQEYKKGYIKTLDGVYFIVRNYNTEISRKKIQAAKNSKFEILRNDSRVAYDGKRIYLDGTYENMKDTVFSTESRTIKNSIYGSDFKTLETVYVPEYYETNKVIVHKDKKFIYFNYWKKDISNVDNKSFKVVEIFNEKGDGNYSKYNSLTGVFFKDKNSVYYKENILEDSNPEKTITILEIFDGNVEEKYGKNDKIGLFLTCNYMEDIQAYSSNNNNIYYKNKKIDNVDIDSFVIEKDNIFYSKDKNNVYFMGEKQKKIDSFTFKVLNYSYIKDKDHVYYENKLLNGADSSSFIVLKNDYAKDKNYVYYNGKILERVDPASFVILNNDYVKDKNAVYYKNIKIDFSDPKTFTIMKSGYSKDKNFAYNGEKMILDAKGSEFIEIKEIYGRLYHKDKENVYLKGVKIEGADPKTFLVIDHEYSKDKKYVYYNGENIGERDYKTFIRLSWRDYTKDKNHIYFENMKINGIDKESFEVIDAPYSKDKNYIYYRTERVDNADIDSFEIIEDSKFYDNDYYKDKNYVFFRGKSLAGVNPSEFKRLGKYTYYYSDGTHLYYGGKRMDHIDYKTFVIYDGIGYSKDKNNVYYEDKIVENADPVTFREIKDKNGNRKYIVDKNNVYDNGGNLHKYLKIKDLDLLE
jgi:hypothetical protein